MTQRVRVFISSPGDTQFERMRIDRVVERLNGEFAGFARLETIRWELEFYKAHATFQQQIPEAADCDIVIAILRHRLGTTLPDDFARLPNGDPYPSGTAYEILTAIEAGRKRGLPDVYVFRNPESPTVRLDDAQTNALVSDQWERLKVFFNTWFRTPTGQFTAAFQEFHSTDEFEAQVDALLRKWLADKILKGRPVVWPIAIKGSPFRGLAAFGARHAPVFFGRSRDITKAVDSLKDAGARGLPFLLVVGPSGAGKSSLAHAGLVPRLTTPGVVPTVDVWRTALMHPGGALEGPGAALARSLFQGEAEQGRPPALPEIQSSDFRTPQELADLLAHADDSCVRPLMHALERAGEAERRKSGFDRPVRTDLLLVVDQLDELFAQDISTEQRGRFTRLLSVLVGTGRVWVIATLRADLYERLLDDSDLLALKTRGASYDLAPPGAAELAEIVRRPAEAAGLLFETDPRSGERLDDRLLADADRPDMLPLLQFTLDQLFAQRETVGEEPRLTFAAYQRLGGLAGAIDREAERAIAALGDPERERLPRLLRQLAAPAHGDDSGRGVARLTTRSIPLAEAAYDEPSQRLVQALIEARVLLASGGDAHANVRLAHQRVLDSWKRAQEITAANADFYRIRQEVEDQQQRWKASGDERDLLIPAGLPLAEAESIRGRYAGELSAELKDYIDASTRRGRARRQRLRVAVAAFALLAVIASAAGIWAAHQQRQAEASLLASRIATSKFLADLARQRLEEGRVGEAVALARRAVPLEIRDWPRVPTAENALALAMQTYSSMLGRQVVGFVGHEGTVRGAAFSPDGKRLLTWSYDATARLWDVETGAQLKVLQHDDGVRGARFSADGRRALSWSFDGSVRLWDLAESAPAIVLRHDDVVVDAVFSKDETRILSWSYDGTARVWDSRSGRQLALLRHQNVVYEARYFNADGRILTRSFDKDVGIWRASDGARLATLKHAAYVRGAVLFAHETRVLTWSDEKSARIWDTSTGQELRRLEHAAAVNAAELSADERRIVTQTDKLVVIWDAATGKQLVRFAHQQSVLGARLSESGTRLLTWSADRTVQLWNAVDGKLLDQTSHSDQVLGARFSPDERQILSWSYDGTAQLLTETAGKTTAKVSLQHEGVVRDAYFTSDGAWVWTRSDDGTVRAWRSADGLQSVVLRHQAKVLGMVRPPAGSRPATFSADGTARLWDLSPADPVVELRHDDKVLGATFASDGNSLLSWSGDRTARVWDVATGKQRLALRDDAGLVGAAFTPDQSGILAWSIDGSIRLWDRDSGTSRAVFHVPSPARGALLSPVNERLLAWFDDGSIHLWNSKTHEQLTEFVHCGERAGGVFSGDGRDVLIWCSDGTLRALDSDRAALIGTMVLKHLSGASLSSDRARVLSWADHGTIRLWSIHGGGPTAEMHEQGSVLAAVLSPRGDRVLSWSGSPTATIWDAGTGKQLQTLAHAKDVNGARFDAGGSRVWTWSTDGSARLWDSTTGDELWRLQLADGVRQLALVADGRRFFTLSETNLVQLWDAGTGDLVASIVAPISSAQAAGTAIADNGRHLAAWSGGSSIFIWPLWVPTEVLAERASRIAERVKPLSPVERCRAHLDTTGCERIRGMTERVLALVGDAKHLRLSARSEPSPGENSVGEAPWNGNDMKVELVVNDRSEAFIFHNQPFRTPLARLEFNVSTRRLVFRRTTGAERDFGLAADPRLARRLEYTDRVLTVYMDVKTGKPISGDYYPLLVY